MYVFLYQVLYSMQKGGLVVKCNESPPKWSLTPNGKKELDSMGIASLSCDRTSFETPDVGNKRPVSSNNTCFNF